MFTTAIALRVLEVIQDAFMGIPNFEESLALLNLHGSTTESDANKWLHCYDKELGLESYTDTECNKITRRRRNGRLQDPHSHYSHQKNPKKVTFPRPEITVRRNAELSPCSLVTILDQGHGF